jgi:lipopolysaccharide heptosyltransferase I
VRLSSFGDVVFTMPAAKALRTLVPHAVLAWAVEEPFAPLVAGASYVDAVLTTRTKAWRRSPFSSATWREAARFRELGRRFAPDLVVDAQGLFKSALVTAAIPAGRRVGFGPRTATERINILATDEHVEAHDRTHALDRGLALAEYVTGRRGLPRFPDVAHLVERPAPEVDAWLASRGGAPFAVVQPFSSVRAKEWPAEEVLALAGHLAAEGIATVVRWGPAERERAEALAAASDGRLSVAPPTNPAATARLAARAQLFVGVDTGPTHLAAASGTPTVALFGPTDPARFGPVGPRTAILRGPYNAGGRVSVEISADVVASAASGLRAATTPLA